MDPLVRGEQELERSAALQRQVLAVRKQGVLLPLDETAVLSVNRAYSLLRTLSKASPRWRSTWNLSKRMLACGTWAWVEVRNGFHMSMTAIRIPLLFLGPSHSKNSSMLASSDPCRQTRWAAFVPSHSPRSGSVPLPDRDLVDADHLRPWLAGSSELLLHVLLLERLDRVPVQMQFLGDILDRRGSASTSDVEAKRLV